MPARRKKPAPVVVEVKVNPATLKVALELAGGDRSRLVINRDGTVTVTNHGRNRDSVWNTST